MWEISGGFNIPLNSVYGYKLMSQEQEEVATQLHNHVYIYIYYSFSKFNRIVVKVNATRYLQRGKYLVTTRYIIYIYIYT